MEWFEEFRKDFPAVRNQIYVNLAYNNPLPTSVIQAMNGCMEEISRGIINKKGWKADHATIRQKLARLVNGKPHEIAFTKNTCEGINIIAQGIDWMPGDNVVVNDQDHLSNVLPWLNLRHRGVEARIVEALDYRLPVDHIMSKADERTRVIAVSYVQYGSGFRVDLASLGKRCRENGMRLVVDAIQAIGILRFDARDWGVDAVACGGHKGLLAPFGVGFLYCDEELLRELTPTSIGPSDAIGLDKTKDYAVEALDLPDARRLEFGNLNFIGIIGLQTGLNLLEKAGIDRIEKRVLTLSRLLNSGFRDLGYRVISSSVPEEQSGLVVLIVPDPDDFWNYLKKHDIIAMRQKAGTIRFSFHAYNNEEEVGRILEVASHYENR